MKEVNGRVLWLQESLVHAATIASTFELVAQKRELTPKEIDMKNITLAFMYLYNVVDDEGLIANTDDSYFGNEVIH